MNTTVEDYIVGWAQEAGGSAPLVISIQLPVRPEEARERRR